MRQNRPAQGESGQHWALDPERMEMVQSELVRDDLQRMIDTNKRVAEVSLRIADEAARIIQAQEDRTADRARRAA